jgi:hypothetical protein
VDEATIGVAIRNQPAAVQDDDVHRIARCGGTANPDGDGWTHEIRRCLVARFRPHAATRTEGQTPPRTGREQRRVGRAVGQ